MTRIRIASADVLRVVRRWLTRAFGPASVSVPAMLLVAPLGIVLAVALGPPGAGGIAAVWAWAVLSQLAFTAVTFGTPRLLRTQRSLVLACGAAMGGAVRGAVMSWGFLAVGIVPTTSYDVAVRMVHSAVACTLWVGFCGVLLQGGADFRASYRSLMAQSLSLQRAAGRPDGVPAEVVERWNAITDALQVTVLRARSHLSAADVTESDLRAAADVISAGVDEGMRSESHRMWRSAELEPPRLRWKELLIAILDPWAPPIRLILAVYGSLMLLGATDRSGPGRGVIFAALLVAEVGVILVGSRALARHFPRRQILLGASTMITMPLVIILVSTAVAQGFLHSPPDRTGVIAAAVGAALVCWTVLIYQRLSNEREILLSSLQARVDEQVLQLLAGPWEAGVWEAELGAFVHHSVSSEMTALHLHLRQAADGAADPAAWDSARRGAELRLRGLESVSPPWSSLPDGRDRIMRLARSWEGIAEVSVELEPDSGEPRRAEQWKRAALVVEEAVAGAVRSGGARHVSVRAASDGANLVVIVDDDGSGMPAHAVPGLGTAWLQRQFGDAWSRQATDRGTRLRVTID